MIQKYKRLKDKYKTLEELKDDILEDYIFVFRKKDNLVVVTPYEVDEGVHINQVAHYYYYSDNCIKKIDVDKLKKELIEILSKHITIKKLIEDVLNTIPPDELMEIYERAVVKKGKIKEEEGCYKLLIGGKRGKPYELAIRD